MMTDARTTTTDEADGGDLLGTLTITKVKPRISVPGTWVTGTIGGHEFEALVFPDHAACESYELGDSRISKLYLRQIAGRDAVACFDRGWDLQPTTPAAAQIIDLLAAGLAELIYA